MKSHRNENVAPQSRHQCCQAVNTTDGHRVYGKKLLNAGSLLSRRNNVYRYGRTAQIITNFLKIFLPRHHQQRIHSII